MKAVFLVLNKVDCLEKLLGELLAGGIKGGTVIESTGMAQVLGDSEEFNILGSLRQLLDPHRVESKTLFFVLPDEQVQIVREIVDRVTGGIGNPNTGILFGFDISFADGLH